MARILLTIPTWNEARVIARTIDAVQVAVKTFLPGHDVVIEIADNASTDGTADIAERVGIRVLRLSEKGKGLAIRRSWEQHLDDTDILVFTDADLSADLSALPALIEPLLPRTTHHEPRTPPADIVCGSRFVEGSVCERRASREIASRLYRVLQRIILGLPVRDAQCGLKAITSSAARQVLPLCHETGWMFDSELLALAHKKGLRIAEIPVHWVEQRDPERRSALRLFRDGWGFLLGLAKIKFRQKA